MLLIHNPHFFCRHCHFSPGVLSTPQPYLIWYLVFTFIRLAVNKTCTNGSCRSAMRCTYLRVVILTPFSGPSAACVSVLDSFTFTCSLAGSAWLVIVR